MNGTVDVETTTGIRDIAENDVTEPGISNIDDLDSLRIFVGEEVRWAALTLELQFQC